MSTVHFGVITTDCCINKLHLLGQLIYGTYLYNKYNSSTESAYPVSENRERSRPRNKVHDTDSRLTRVLPINQAISHPITAIWSIRSCYVMYVTYRYTIPSKFRRYISDYKSDLKRKALSFEIVHKHCLETRSKRDWNGSVGGANMRVRINFV